MPAGSLLSLLDDVALLLDDVFILTKKATAKTAGVLGDDLALNAEQVSGLVSARELPVIWAVAKGAFLNKLILVPLALAISSFAPWAIIPLLMAGGLFLCFEGCEKLLKLVSKRREKSISQAAQEIGTPLTADAEKTRIKGAVRTDFVLSAEVLAITLSTVAGYDFTRQLFVLSAISIVMTVGVYGLVAGIVKLDDAGLYLTQRPRPLPRRLGYGILWGAPFFMKTLSIAGTAAMFLVGGGIITHGIAPLHGAIINLQEIAQQTGGVATLISGIIPPVLSGLCGLLAGAVALLIVLGIKRGLGKSA